MKNDTPKKEHEEIKAPKGAERFTAHIKQAGKYTFGEVYDFDDQFYRLAAIMNDGDGVALEFVKVQ
jgi:hypothetical protein